VENLLTSGFRRIVLRNSYFSYRDTNFPSTTVENSLQIRLFMQNKPNFQKAQMNVTVFYTKEYESQTLSRSGKNKANTKPIQTQTNPIKPKTNPKQTQNKPNSNPIEACPERSRMGQFPGFPCCNTLQNGLPPIILVSLNGFCIISFSVVAILQIFMESI